MSLCGPLIATTGRDGIFATARVTNPAMHATLLKLKFERVGREWPSLQSDDNLCLFTRVIDDARLEPNPSRLFEAP
jgi:hypothetical protein